MGEYTNVVERIERKLNVVIDLIQARVEHDCDDPDPNPDVRVWVKDGVTVDVRSTDALKAVMRLDKPQTSWAKVDALTENVQIILDALAQAPHPNVIQERRATEGLKGWLTGMGWWTGA